MRNISVSIARNALGGETEYVERKGLGHPDSLIDGIVDRVSCNLSKAYLDNFGTILHHNVDKGLIVGGEAVAEFGRGRITKKIEVIVAGRAASHFGRDDIDTNGLIVKTVKDYLKANTRFLNVDAEVRITPRVNRGSGDLNRLFVRGSGVPLANDTSFGIGFAPLTETERIVLETEKYLNSRAYKARVPACGEDIKVMGLRNGNRIKLTVSAAVVAGFINDIDAYAFAKDRIRRDIEKFAERFTDKGIEVDVNAADNFEDNGIYLTKSGLSCEAGDDGSVGRGNRVNGLITPFRAMSLEAAAGKNPVNHVGKIYNILATELAKDITGQYGEVEDCNIAILSQIGKGIDDPQNLHISIAVDKHANNGINSKVSGIANGWLDNLGGLTREIALGKYAVF